MARMALSLLLSVALLGASALAAAGPVRASDAEPKSGVSDARPAGERSTPEDDEDNTRAVRIIDEKAFPPAASQAPAAAAPLDADPQTYEIGNTTLKADNAAGLLIDILPGQQLQAGAKIVFKISSKRPGYLMLVDVDPTGKLTQIYPNQRSLMSGKAREGANRMRPGRTITIPDPGDPLAGFEFVAAPPNGVAMVVAILSDKPVQLIDLPDVPAEFAGQQAALKYLTDFARNLKIADNDTGALEETKWSFDAKLYVIR